MFLVWPRVQRKPDGETNRAVLKAHDVRIVKIEQVEVDDDNNHDRWFRKGGVFITQKESI